MSVPPCSTMTGQTPVPLVYDPPMNLCDALEADRTFGSASVQGQPRKGRARVVSQLDAGRGTLERLQRSL